MSSTHRSCLLTTNREILNLKKPPRTESSMKFDIENKFLRTKRIHREEWNRSRTGSLTINWFPIESISTSSKPIEIESMINLAYFFSHENALAAEWWMFSRAGEIANIETRDDVWHHQRGIRIQNVRQHTYRKEAWFTARQRLICCQISRPILLPFKSSVHGRSTSIGFLRYQ